MYNIIMEKDYCNKCGRCCDRIAVDFSRNILYRDGIQPLTPDFVGFLIKGEQKDAVTFCTCKFLVNNLCTNPNKPDICKNYPSSPFAFLPEDCGYYGYIFTKHENFMQKIRKLKEEILHYETLMLSAPKDDAKQYAKIIEQHKRFIDKYKMYCPDT